MGSSKDDLREFPTEVRRVMGFAINDAQNGEEHPAAKKRLRALMAEVSLTWSMTSMATLSGGLHRPLRWRHLCPALLPKEVQEGLGDPKHDIHVIRSRLRAAEAHYRATYEKGAKP
jgi:hypothetical protein